ncbi:cellular morphogenesis/cytokinesis regulation protein [Encephalitozoon hellem ATCC 50504]|uniref:Exportin-1 n=1 Tax=Encephalitozoon hellem TaxID=27973 RepID=A0A9Q9F962_ENCHE|nr:cellular morphogenesis/cytokinesis regulation protein [Encephalitozoon hellem ATCC 50504]AFM99270.1 cellular morphogenesis/cytokinesis regulation protein [Encephalitozoon hellem ATCC 50504]UTX44258.1 putative exportin-1 [Encephalitozoon hellem]WEL39749.1 Ras GTPase-activating-like protein [Encephalitozoon hellem]|eukprot:XP_003888251.1 cellular morphogenesis/cytokinesis regulation protein [Encephalitozoon hellem ATCC 50504]
MESRKEELKRNSINVHQRLGTDVHVSSEDMDKERRNTRAYEYLCRLEEAKSWLGEFSSVPESFEEFEEEMRKGVILTDICRIFAPSSVKNVFVDSTLQYRHTDNINYFLDGVMKIGLPEYFHFEVIDLYEKKNFVKVIYCVHALAHLLSSKGISGNIKSAKGKVFSHDDMARADVQVEKLHMPKFDNIGDVLKEKMAMEAVDSEENEAKKEVLDQESTAEPLDKEGSFLSEDVSVCDESFDILKLTLRTFLYKKCFDDIYYRKDVSLFSIRRFVFIFFSNSSEMVKEKLIENLHHKISRKFDSIYAKEAQIKDIETRIRLIVQNRMEIGNITIKNPIPEDEDTRDFERVLLFLQNNPKYLSELLRSVNDPDSLIVSIVIPIFSNVCSKKEEYMFINLVLEIFRRELLDNGLDVRKLVPIDMSLGIHSSTFFSLELFKEIESPIHHTLASGSVCHKLMVNYFRVSQGSFSLRDKILHVVKNLENIEVDANPVLIYKMLFNQSASADKALENERVREAVQTRLMVMRGVISSALDLLESSVESIPYILRYFLKLYGAGMFYTEFVMPFILAPDAFIESFEVSKSLRNKCFIISKVLEHIADRATSFDESDNDEEEKNDGIGGPSFSNGERKSFELKFYSPLYSFFRRCRERYQAILSRLTDVSSLDHYFQFESMNELGKLKRATVHLPSSTANQLITLLLSNARLLGPEMCEILESLPLFPDDHNKTLSFTFFGPEWICSQDPEKIALDNFVRGLKKKLIYAISVCKGRNLVEMLLRESDEEERSSYLEMKRHSFCSKNEEDESSIASPPSQYESIDQLKESIIDDLNFLEDKNVTSRHNLYSELLFMLAQDIVILRFMSEERSKELRINEISYDNLCYRDDYLSGKIELYQSYLNSFVAKLAIKKRSLFGFSGIDDIARDSKYGTHKYSAEKLMSMGVLVQVYDSPDISEIFFLFLSEAPLLFSVEVYVQNILVSHPVSFRFDDLLKLRKNGNNICDIAGICSFSVCRFIDLVNSKYIGSEI